MKNKTFGTIPLFLLLSFFACLTLKANYYFPNLNADNVETVKADIMDFYKETYEGEDDIAFNTILDELLNELTLEQVDTEACFPGTLFAVNYEHSNNSLPIPRSLLSIRWNEPGEQSESFYFAYIDMTNLLKWDTLSQNPGFTYQFAGTSQYKLLVTNARCSESQSDYFIIIVDRDLNLASLNAYQQQRSEEATNLLPAFVPELSITPNPIFTHEKLLTLSFELPEKSSISLYLINAQTALLHRRIFENTLLESGNHRQLIDLGALSPGYYYLVLQTGQSRLTKGLVVL